MVESMVGKGENAGDQHFSISQFIFKRLHFWHGLPVKQSKRHEEVGFQPDTAEMNLKGE